MFLSFLLFSLSLDAACSQKLPDCVNVLGKYALASVSAMAAAGNLIISSVDPLLPATPNKDVTSLSKHVSIPLLLEDRLINHKEKDDGSEFYVVSTGVAKRSILGFYYDSEKLNKELGESVPAVTSKAHEAFANYYEDDNLYYASTQKAMAKFLQLMEMSSYADVHGNTVQPAITIAPACLESAAQKQKNVVRDMMEYHSLLKTEVTHECEQIIKQAAEDRDAEIARAHDNFRKKELAAQAKKLAELTNRYEQALVAIRNQTILHSLVHSTFVDEKKVYPVSNLESYLDFLDTYNKCIKEGGIVNYLS